MRILAIETSCDDTAIAVIEAKGGFSKPSFKVLASVAHSQIALHAKWCGVVPSLAKREHSKNLVPLLKAALGESGLLIPSSKGKGIETDLAKILERETEIMAGLDEFLPKIETPKIDAIAVTYGPGLEPALWTGINLAKALALTWKKPLVPINHMEGHAFSALLTEKESKVNKVHKVRKVMEFPVVALLVSGGHTELVLSKDWLKYKVLGRTRDDAAGEAFDKAARMIGLPYPGGPEISRLASEFDPAKKIGITLPRPMINSGDLDFSFSGLKTAVLYKIKELGTLSEDLKREISHEFESAVVETLIAKTKKALTDNGAKTLVVGGGVSANPKLRTALAELIEKYFPGISLHIPERKLSVDNAVMIAAAGYFRSLKKKPSFNAKAIKKLEADGNLSL